MNKPCFGWLRTDGGKDLWLADGQAARDCPLQILFVPCEQILLRSVQLKLRGRKLQQALPYALEDDLVGDSEDLLFIPGRADTGGRVPVAVLDAEQLQGWQEEHSARAWVPDCFLLPEPEAGHWHLLITNGRMLVRLSRGEGFATDADSLPGFLQAHLPEEQTPELHAWRLPDAPRPETLLGEAWSLKTLTDISGVAKLHSDWSKLSLPLRLRVPNASGLPLPSERQWLPAAGLALVALLAHGVFQQQQAEEWRSSALALQTDVEERFRQVFPEVKRVVEIEAQTRQQLNKRRAANGGGNDRFLALLDRSAPVLGEAEGIQLQGMKFAAEKLMLDLQAKDMAGLETLRNALAERGLQVSQGSFTRQGEGLRTLLEIGMRGEG